MSSKLAHGAAAAGVFGKLASQGDFVTRRLPADFVPAWDTRLQEGMRASRACLGADWLARYLQAPVWRFALAPGVCGQAAIAGVLLPSIDRVGRYFPLTLAAVRDPGATSCDAPGASAPWFDALAELGVAAMCGTLSVAALDVALDKLGPPSCACPSSVEAGAMFWLDGFGMPPVLRLHEALPDAKSLGAMLVYA